MKTLKTNQRNLGFVFYAWQIVGFKLMSYVNMLIYWNFFVFEIKIQPILWDFLFFIAFRCLDCRFVFFYSYVDLCKFYSFSFE